MTTIATKPSTAAEQSVLEKMYEMGHEQVVFCNDEATGLRAIIAIHNTVLGPALGGTRMWKYNSDAEALQDVLRLSKGMTYKAAVTGLNLGGGKAVIIGDARKDKSEALMRRFGKFVNSLSGKYITAEDVGIGTPDMEFVNMETKYVSGIPESYGGSGDPSPVTAYGVYLGIKASAKEVYGSDSLAGKKVAVQGIGHVGEYLVKHLVEEGAKVIISDIYEDRIKDVTSKYGVTAVSPDAIYDADMDIYAPCALGATLNDNTIDRLKCAIVAGAANNQLANEVLHGEALIKKGILYAPDFVINAGGLINVYTELEGYNRQRAMEKAAKIYDTTLDIFKISKEKNIPTYRAANQKAEDRINAIAKVKVSF
jgi:leucine dehydrogenase